MRPHVTGKGPSRTIRTALAAALFASRLRADALAEPIRVELDAPAVCGTAADFFEAVRRHTDRVAPATGGSDERRLVIRVAPVREGFAGSLQIVDPAGASAERRMIAADCSELMAALSIVAALAVDPAKADASGAGSAGVDAASSAEPVAPPAATPAPAAIPPPPQVMAPPSHAPVPGDEPHHGTSSSAVWFIGAEVGLDVLTPTPLLFPTAGLDADVVFRSPSFVQPDVHLAVRRSLDANVTSASGHASFALTTLRIAACPLRLDASRALSASPCAVLDGGAISAAGHDVQRQQSHLRPWVAAGGEARLIVGSGALRLALAAGVVAPLVQDTFRFEPTEVVYEVAGVLPYASISVAFGPVGGSGDR